MKEIKCTCGPYARSFNDIDFDSLQFRDTHGAYRTLKIQLLYTFRYYTHILLGQFYFMYYNNIHYNEAS